ncbi:MAG: peptidoglycan recognition family protein [Leptolyngbyaceae cyanobacterium bins.59]|nr:peptidoglycan recognition family protein [Leptolyngbyaceae cyanobacterium bins.59]
MMQWLRATLGKFSRLTGLMLLFIGLLLLVVQSDSARSFPELPDPPGEARILSQRQNADQMLVAACQLEQEADPNFNHRTQTLEGITLATKQVQSGFVPRQRVALAHPSNFDRRFVRDVRGRSVSNEPIVVLHETVGSANGVIGLFQTNHPRDEDQLSYHTLITLSGTVIYIVPPDKRAFGAGNSVFRGPQGAEAVQTNPKFPASVNNFAYHISLETPSDGMHNGRRHSGYTRAQYESLGWLVAKTGVPDERITTHKAVDRSGSRQDPRSFSFDRFRKILNSYPRQDEIGLRCGVQPPEPPDDLHQNQPPAPSGNAIGR